MMCSWMHGNQGDMVWCMGIKTLLVVWIIFVPIVITNRLETIIKLLKDKK